MIKREGESVLGVRKRERERERKVEHRERDARARGHGIARRYTWIIDFVHERATTGASKIPVALIVVNCPALYGRFSNEVLSLAPSGG